MCEHMRIAAVRQAAASGLSLPRGHVFFQTDFERPDALQPWSGSAGTIVADQNGHVLLVGASEWFAQRLGNGPAHAAHRADARVHRAFLGTRESAET